MAMHVGRPAPKTDTSMNKISAYACLASNLFRLVVVLLPLPAGEIRCLSLMEHAIVGLALSEIGKGTVFLVIFHSALAPMKFSLITGRAVASLDSLETISGSAPSLMSHNAMATTRSSNPTVSVGARKVFTGQIRTHVSPTVVRKTRFGTEDFVTVPQASSEFSQICNASNSPIVPITKS